MSEPTPIHKRRNYSRSKATKIAAIVAAELTTNVAAGKAFRVPESTVRSWRDNPELAKYCDKTREDLAAGAQMLASLALEQIANRIGEFEPRDLVVLMGVAVDKGQLLSGQATDRLETRDVTANLPDEELEAVTTSISEWLKARRVDALPDGS